MSELNWSTSCGNL